jgi:polysaccharide biosynthesis transport protein
LPGLHVVDLQLADKSADQGAPVLHSCPATPEQNYWLREYDAYGFMEAFRTLGTSLNQTILAKKSLVVTSALPHEGRSTVAIHLAQAIAAMGQRVLLIDAHLRKGSSRIHTLMNLPESRGLSDYLMGDASILEVVQRLAWEPNLFVMPSGTPAPDPTRLLASEQMTELMHQMEQSFDLIIYVTLPLMGLADVKLVAAEAGGILLVTKLGCRGSADALAYTTSRLKEARLPIVGIVANGVRHYTVDLYA